MLDKAKQKDPGFDLYWFAIALNRSLNFPDEPERWPVNRDVEGVIQLQDQVLDQEYLRLWAERLDCLISLNVPC